ncbi:unnamed protein product [Linum tenue]|uniref:Uncharacterized protein n=1 Tax=Linum tenue TaxID=586396 RepID=A0AAV0QLD3_9ROSI|nr:unnamed protein product [Linum tenue]
MTNFSGFSLIHIDLNPALEYLIKNFSVKNGAIAAAAGSPLLIAGTICIAWAYGHRAWRMRKEPPAVAAPVFTRSISLGALHGGRVALERLLDYHTIRADAAALEAAEDELRAQIVEPKPHFKKLQSAAAKFEMSGKEAVAIAILEKELERAKFYRRPHELYEIEMLLVELYIYKGDLKKALTCDCLTHTEISDARRPLYKAVIHIMLGNNVEARRLWEEFRSIRSEFEFPPGNEDEVRLVNEVIEDFTQFEKVVKLVQKDIQAAQARRS